VQGSGIESTGIHGSGRGMVLARPDRMAKREAISNNAGDFYARRDSNGRFAEMDEKGRSLAADRRTKAKTKVKSGQGDRGDRAR